MLLLAWISGMLEALESGAEAWRAVSPERFRDMEGGGET